MLSDILTFLDDQNNIRYINTQQVITYIHNHSYNRYTVHSDYRLFAMKIFIKFVHLFSYTMFFKQ